MSGSPVFIDGKVACAISYTFRFTQQDMALCTPLEYMVAEGRRIPRGIDATIVASADEWERLAPLDRLASAGQEAGRAVDAWLLRTPLPTPPPEQPVAGLPARAGLPLSVSGLGPTAFAQAQKVFEPYGLQVAQGGGSGNPTTGPAAFEMGGPIAGEL